MKIWMVVVSRWMQSTILIIEESFVLASLQTRTDTPGPDTSPEGADLIVP